MDLDQTLGLRILTNIGSTPVNCQIKDGWSHIDASGRVILIAKPSPGTMSGGKKRSPSEEGLPLLLGSRSVALAAYRHYLQAVGV
jgi:hypothetical protein